MNPKVIADGLVTLLVKRFAGPFWLRRRQLERTQWFNKQELQDLQLKLLKRIVSHSYNTVPYYRKLMNESGIHVEDIKTLDDVKLFPVLTKTDVLKAGDSLVSTKYPKWALRTARTGGSTGTPMTIRRNWCSIGNEHAFVRRQWDWAGMGLHEKCACLSGRVIVKGSGKAVCPYTYDPMMKELILSTYHLSPNTAKEYAHLIKERGVKAIIGYPSALYLIAKICLDMRIEMKLSAALTTSEVLTDVMRQTIGRAFGCDVFDFYGLAERVCYIHTCEHHSYHILPEYGLTELIPVGDSDTNHCRIVSTGFWNKAMPLIRYDTGDVVVKSNNTCACGRNFPVIKSVIGRQGDVIKSPSGERFGVTILIHLLYVICGANNILETQFIQDSPSHITVEYVPCERFSNADFSVAKKRFVEHLSRGLEIDFKQVKAVGRTKSGKVRPVVSQII